VTPTTKRKKTKTKRKGRPPFLNSNTKKEVEEEPQGEEKNSNHFRKRVSRVAKKESGKEVTLTRDTFLYHARRRGILKRK